MTTAASHRVEVRAVLLAAAALLLAIATAAGAWIALPIFAVAGAAFLGLVAYLAVRWPLATLVAAALAVLADPVVFNTLLPDTIDLGPIGASEPMLAVTGGVIAVRAVRRGAFWPALRDPLLPLVALFVVIGLVSASVNGVPAPVAMLGILMTIDAIAVYFLARMVPAGEGEVRMAIWVVVAAVVVAAVVGIMQVVLHPDLLGLASFAGRFGEGGRITSFLGNPNMAAAVIVFALPYPLLATRHLTERRNRGMAFGVTALLCLALILTFSRGAWLAFIVGVVLTLLVLDRRSLLTLVAGLALAWFATIVMPRNVLVSQAELTELFPDSGAPSIIDSTMDRLDEVYERRDLRMRFIREGLPIVADNPWLGVGPGRYGGAASAIIESPVYEKYGTSLYGFRTVHNFWLHLFGEVGVVGGSVFVVAIVGLWLRFVMAAQAAVDGHRFLVLAGTASAIAVLVMNNATEMLFEGNFPGFVVWLVIGLASLGAPPRRLLGHDRSARTSDVAD